MRNKRLTQTDNLEYIEASENLDVLQRIISITKSCSKRYFRNILNDLTAENEQNANIICDYITAEETEINIKNSTKEGKIKVLVWLSKHHDNKISFTDMKKQHILEFLNNLRKTIHKDPSQKWIGSYNGRQIILNKFFRWLYDSQEPDHSRRVTPECMRGVKQLPKKKNHPMPHRIFGNKEKISFS